MTEHTPRNYVPKNAKFAETLIVTLATSEESFDRACAAAEAAQEGKQTPAVVSFEKAENLQRLLTDSRVEVLRTIMDEAPDSISELAEQLNRDLESVKMDVEIFVECGIAYYSRQGNSDKPVIPYEAIEFSVTINSDSSGNDSTR